MQSYAEKIASESLACTHNLKLMKILMIKLNIGGLLSTGDWPMAVCIKNCSALSPYCSILHISNVSTIQYSLKNTLLQLMAVGYC